VTILSSGKAKDIVKSLKYNQKDATFSRSIYFYILLYMFQALLRPSSGAQNCTYSVRYCLTNTAACCYRGWDGTDGRRNRLKHVEKFIEINKPRELLHLVGCTLEIYSYLRWTDTWTTKLIVAYAFGIKQK